MKYGHILAIVAALYLVPVAAQVVHGETINIGTGELMVSPAAVPPGADGPWAPVTLPDIWPRPRYGLGGNGWYRFRLRLDAAPADVWGIYLPRVNMNAAVYLNGRFLGDGGRFDEPMARNWTRPLYFTAAPHLWRAGDNELLVRLKSYPGYGLLDVLHAGPDAILRPGYLRHAMIQEDLNGALFFATAMVGLLMSGLWLRRRQDTMYLWFAGAALAWSVYALNAFIRYIPVSARVWDWLIYSSTAWWTVLLAVFARRIAGLGRSPLEWGFWAWVGASTLVYAVVDGRQIGQATALLQTGSIVVGALVVWQLFAYARRERRGEARVLGVGIALVLATGVHDWLIQSHLIAVWWPYGSHIMHYSAPLLILFVGWHLTGRFVRALNESEALNADLEHRITAARRELAQSYAEIHAMEKQRAVVQERDRIYRDLHDDVGAKLLSLVYRASDASQSELARSALRDLRDVVSGAAVQERGLAEALADWRAECQDRLDSGQTRLMWQEPESLPDWRMTPQQTANLGRTLREALSNALHHARPRQVTVRIGCGDGKLSFEVHNDGVTEPEPTRSGRGTGNMRRRIEELGGSIEWDHLQEGGVYRVAWRVPLAAGN